MDANEITMNTTPSNAPIVVSTDFSEEAAIAVERAAQIAKRLAAPLYVFHVFNSGIWASLKNIYSSALWTGTDLAVTVLASETRRAPAAAGCARGGCRAAPGRRPTRRGWRG